jgi:glutathione-specific gamma-glutamylcyclotransferase
MWRPGFPFVEKQASILHGRRRAFCMYAIHHRSSAERPGLTLGLAPGGSVRGAFRIEENRWHESATYLRQRELATGAYLEALTEIRLLDGRKIETVVFLSDMTHPQWAGDLSRERQCDLILNASGVSGRNVDYLCDLGDHLATEGIRDRNIEALLAMVRERMSS